MKQIASLLVVLGALNGCAATQVPAQSQASSALAAASFETALLSADEVAPAADAVHEAEPVFAPRPEYPDAERQIGIEAKVRVTYAVDELGKVINARAVGPAAFRAKALEAIAQWRFRPATRSGAPLRSRRATNFVFRIHLT